MAKKKKKNDGPDLGQVVDKLISEVGDDRTRLVEFLDKLISAYDDDEGKSVGIAEYVAKLADALTKQHQVKASMLKIISKSQPEGDDEMDLDGLQDEIGLPFKPEGTDDGAN